MTQDWSTCNGGRGMCCGVTCLLGWVDLSVHKHASFSPVAIFSPGAWVQSRQPSLSALTREDSFYIVHASSGDRLHLGIFLFSCWLCSLAASSPALPLTRPRTVAASAEATDPRPRRREHGEAERLWQQPYRQSVKEEDDLDGSGEGVKRRPGEGEGP